MAADPRAAEDLRDELEEMDAPDVVRLLGEERPEIAVPPGSLDPDSVERRAMLAAALLPSMFPTSTEEVALAIADADLPPDLVLAIEALPARSFSTVQEIWVALGGAAEEREASPERELGGVATRRSRRQSGTSTARTPSKVARRVAEPLERAASRLPGAPAGVRGRVLPMVRTLTSLPLATAGAACTLGAGVLQRAADDLTDAASRIAGART